MQPRLYAYWMNQQKPDKVSFKNNSRQLTIIAVLKQSSVCYESPENSCLARSFWEVSMNEIIFKKFKISPFQTFTFQAILPQIFLLILRLGTLRNTCFRSNRPEVFLAKGILKICSKFTEKPPCRSVISIKLFCNSGRLVLLLKRTLKFQKGGNSSHWSRYADPKATLRNVLKSFAKIIGKRLRRSLIFKVAAVLQISVFFCDFFKTDSPVQVFSCKFGKFLRALFYRLPPSNRFCWSD